jgi:hypothetical protein
MDLEIKEHLVNKSPTTTTDWTRKLRHDEMDIVGMKAPKK